MRKTKIILFMAVWVLTISLKAQRVTVDYNKSVDFSNYQTLSFLGLQKDSDQLINDFDKKRMRDAFVKEFKSRGFVKVEEGNTDIEITLYLVLKQKTSTTRLYQLLWRILFRL